jgi:phenylacetate-CoA ligase
MNVVFDQFLKAIERTERLPPRELARYHQELLIHLVRHAYDKLPFYRERLEPLFASEGEIDLTRWNSVPILTRDDIIARGQEMRVADLPAEYGEISEAQTSGSTGVPLKLATNGMVFLAANALFTRAVRRFGIDPSRPLAFIGRFRDDPVPPYPDGAIKTGWSFSDPAAPFYKLELMTTLVDQQVEWLARRRAPYLATMPSGALGIAHAVTPEQGRALGIEVVILTGETVPDGTRELIAERLGARIVPIYACREIGHIASECEAGRYHVGVENALVEIVDNEGRDVAFGSRGRVVVTGLYNYVMPFIRYEIGDIAVAGSESCPCGRTLPIIKQIEGRRRNMFVFRDGTRFWPRSAMIRPMHAFVPFRRYQLVQLDHETIEFRYMTDGSGREPDVSALNAYARQTIHPSITLRVVAVDQFTAGPSGKVQEFVSNLAAASTLPVAGALL